MRILITNLFVANFSGSETVVELLADGLRRAGHQPAVFAPQLGPQANAMRARGHIVVDRTAMVPWRPDVIHAQHVTPAMMAMAAFPDVPVVFACHSAQFEVEAPRPHPQIRRIITVDELCRLRCVARGVPADRLSVILNAIDLDRFAARPPLPPRPARALLLTKNTGHQALVRAACARAGIMLDELGPAAGRVTDRLETELPNYDLVFATARMALEAAAVGCAVIVGDGRGFAGLLTSALLPEWRRLNLGAGLLVSPWSAAGLDAAIAAYDAADAAAVSAALRRDAGTGAQAAAHVAVYAAAIVDPPPADPAARAAADAAWLEDLLPSTAPRAWRAIAEELCQLPPAETALESQVRMLLPLVEAAIAKEIPIETGLAARLDAMVPLLHSIRAARSEAMVPLLESVRAARLDAVVPLLQSIRAAQSVRHESRFSRTTRALWRRVVPHAVRQPLHRWRRRLFV